MRTLPLKWTFQPEKNQRAELAPLNSGAISSDLVGCSLTFISFASFAIRLIASGRLRQSGLPLCGLFNEYMKSRINKIMARTKKVLIETTLTCPADTSAITKPTDASRMIKRSNEA